MSNFVHLHLHTSYSLLDSSIRHEPLIKRAAEFGMPAVAMTDHGNMFGAVEFYNTAKDPLQKNDLAGKTLSSAAQAAKDKLQAALDSMPAKALKLRSKGSVTETPKPTRKPRKKKPAKK